MCYILYMDGIPESSAKEQGPVHSPKSQPVTLRFSPGSIFATPAALIVVSPSEIMSALKRHCTGDWGDVQLEDWQANQRALHEGTRLLSSYRNSKGEVFWIITEANRSSTSILLPADY
jgi:hypothetical protein